MRPSSRILLTCRFATCHLSPLCSIDDIQHAADCRKRGRMPHFTLINRIVTAEQMALD